MFAGSTGSTKKGVQWDDRATNVLPASSANLGEAFWSLESSLSVFLVNCLVFGVLTFYFDNVIATEYGRRQPYYFFLLPSYWLGEKQAENDAKTDLSKKSRS